MWRGINQEWPAFVGWGIRSDDHWYRVGKKVMSDIGNRTFVIAKCESGLTAKLITFLPQLMKRCEEQEEELTRLRADMQTARDVLRWLGKDRKEEGA